MIRLCNYESLTLILNYSNIIWVYISWVIKILRRPHMETTKAETFNPFGGLATIEEILAKLDQTLEMNKVFYQESSDPKELGKLAQEAIQKIQRSN